ncbi:hypothetical protein ACIQCN_04045 [Pseudarthrobacter sp. NPDC092424]|uniref:hypothetical protein n=1 Tax=Pseudarthrobacter sp. NPDC092424 TaxID=3364415 RepID=UPI0038197263
MVLVNAAGLFSKPVRELTELLPRYGQHNIFDSTKSTAQFPDFRVTGYRDGLATINQEADAARRAGTSLTPIRTLGTDSQPTFSIGGN